MKDDTGHILVVDDHEVNRDLLVRQLKRQHYEVTEAVNGREALDMMRQESFDLILLDIMMPVMDGYQVLEVMRGNETLRQIPVVVVSALNDIESVVRCVELGADDYLFKPVDRVLLRARVTASMEKKRLREQQLEHLQEINRLKDEFVRMASHDLKNPIHVLTGYVDLLEESGLVSGDPIGETILEGLQKGVARITALVVNLLDLSKIEAGHQLERADVSLDTFLTDCLQGFDLLANEKQITLEYTAPPPELTLSLDSARMGQVINNLLSNAVKYTPQGGRVALETHTGAEGVTIQVIDNGLGIPEEDVPHLFEKFYRVKRQEHLASEGTGLGLAIVKAILDNHGGEIWVESELGSGSVFNIWLPTYV